MFSESDTTKEVGTYALRGALYTVKKMSDGHTLFSELYQVEAMTHVDVVIGKTKESNRDGGGDEQERGGIPEQLSCGNRSSCGTNQAPTGSVCQFYHVAGRWKLQMGHTN